LAQLTVDHESFAFIGCRQIICGHAPLRAMPITVSKDGFITKDGKKIFVKAIGYGCRRPKGEPSFSPKHDHGHLEADLQRIKDAGYNTVRTWQPFSEKALKIVESHGFLLIMGLCGWNPHRLTPGHDPEFKEKWKQNIQKTLSYSKRSDNIIGYLIANEPQPDMVQRNGWHSTLAAWKEATEYIHAEHPGPLVSISHCGIGFCFAEFEEFDCGCYNLYCSSAGTEALFGYQGFVAALRKLKSADKPLFVTEFGIPCLPHLKGKPNGPGVIYHNKGQDQEKQAEANVYMYKSLVDGGATGACMFMFADKWGWDADGKPSHGKDDTEQHFGLIEWKDADDTVGMERKTWKAIKEFMAGIITEPKSLEIYSTQVPLEVFVNASLVTRMDVTLDGSMVHQADFDAEHYETTLDLDVCDADMKDANMVFKFYNAAGGIVKTEEKLILITTRKVTLPTIDITFDNESAYWKREEHNIIATFRVNPSPDLTMSDKITYQYQIYKGFYSGFFKVEDMPPEKVKTKKWPEPERSADQQVLSLGASVEVTFGAFKKRVGSKLVFSGIKPTESGASETCNVKEPTSD